MDIRVDYQAKSVDVQGRARIVACTAEVHPCHYTRMFGQISKEYQNRLFLVQK